MSANLEFNNAISTCFHEQFIPLGTRNSYAQIPDDLVINQPNSSFIIPSDLYVEGAVEIRVNHLIVLGQIIAKKGTVMIKTDGYLFTAKEVKANAKDMKPENLRKYSIIASGNITINSQGHFAIGENTETLALLDSIPSTKAVRITLPEKDIWVKSEPTHYLQQKI